MAGVGGGKLGGGGTGRGVDRGGGVGSYWGGGGR